MLEQTYTSIETRVLDPESETSYFIYYAINITVSFPFSWEQNNALIRLLFENKLWKTDWYQMHICEL